MILSHPSHIFTFNVQCVAHAVADPRAGSRPYFHRVGYGVDDPNETEFSIQLFFATHAGIGGDPWEGDHPMAPTLDQSEPHGIGHYIRQKARAAGVIFKYGPW